MIAYRCLAVIYNEPRSAAKFVLDRKQPNLVMFSCNIL